ncbi:protein of unknown function (plasmid) [Magnetospirillum sp. XM-1]|uniref:hypothetical protein n=1 Tax=Magnetospirillum sp. XM-1 TaxID=1663591 RepID=UPI00073DBC66|nr:hypothetical protein [Magnetospirillum sp. XM-1]CUW41957.1 protein of unknown function [Magnetospirillum sp. XM-1]
MGQAKSRKSGIADLVAFTDGLEVLARGIAESREPEDRVQDFALVFHAIGRSDGQDLYLMHELASYSSHMAASLQALRWQFKANQVRQYSILGTLEAAFYLNGRNILKNGEMLVIGTRNRTDSYWRGFIIERDASGLVMGLTKCFEEHGSFPGPSDLSELLRSES